MHQRVKVQRTRGTQKKGGSGTDNPTTRCGLLGPGQKHTAEKGPCGERGKQAWASGWPQAVTVLWPHHDALGLRELTRWTTGERVPHVPASAAVNLGDSPPAASLGLCRGFRVN